MGYSGYEHFKTNFTNMLRELCGKKGSINVVCRDLRINRQQFAKYLAGTNLPSAFIIQRFILYFAVDPSVFFIERNPRRRFATKPLTLDTAAILRINDGFYLEYTLAAKPDYVSIGLWRFERTERRLFCHGEIPHFRQGRTHAFDSFNGQVVAFGNHCQLLANAQNSSSAVCLTLSQFDASTSDLLAVRITSIVNHEVVQCTPSILRYVGPEIDIAKSLATQCGIIKFSRLDNKSSAIVKLLSERVMTHGDGFSLAL